MRLRSINEDDYEGLGANDSFDRPIRRIRVSGLGNFMHEGMRYHDPQFIANICERGFYLELNNDCDMDIAVIRNGDESWPAAIRSLAAYYLRDKSLPTERLVAELLEVWAQHN